MTTPKMIVSKSIHQEKKRRGERGGREGGEKEEEEEEKGGREEEPYLVAHNRVSLVPSSKRHGFGTLRHRDNLFEARNTKTKHHMQTNYASNKYRKARTN